MRNYSKYISSSPQTEPEFGRTDMVKNNAGGYSFEVSQQELLERFLLIGSEGGTFYVKEQKLTVDTAKKIVEYIRFNGSKVLKTVVEFAVERKAPKVDSGLFVLALLATYGSPETKKSTYASINKVCNTATHLFTFISNVTSMRGWSRGLRKGVAAFYTDRAVDQVAYQMVKYRNRSDFTHRDVLRLAHPATGDKTRNNLFAWAVENEHKYNLLPQIVQQYIQTLSEHIDTPMIVELVKLGKLPWEALPTDSLNNPEVLKDLAVTMPMMALIRNLNRFARADLTKGNSDTTKMIVSRLNNAEEVKKSGIHPLFVVNAMLTYSNGRGNLSDKTWNVNQNIVDAMSNTYDLALKSLVPTGKNILVGVDWSGSMNHDVGGMSMQAAQIANILALTILKSEPNAEILPFTTGPEPLTFGRRNSLDTVLKLNISGGGTDCAVPIVHALNTKNKYDAIIILTDNETWAGKIHGFKALEMYRKQVNPDVKVIEVAMVANPTTNHPKDDKNVLRIVGFDSNVIGVINSYLK